MFWCYQTCANGTAWYGNGNSFDEAWQNLPGCGAGGGPIYCSDISQINQ